MVLKWVCGTDGQGARYDLEGCGVVGYFVHVDGFAVCTFHEN